MAQEAQDGPVQWRPTFSDGAGETRGETIRFKPDPPPMKVGDSVTLISSEGVTLLEVVQADENGGELRVAKPR